MINKDTLVPLSALLTLASAIAYITMVSAKTTILEQRIDSGEKSIERENERVYKRLDIMDQKLDKLIERRK